jgi:hypothetical protein
LGWKFYCCQLIELAAFQLGGKIISLEINVDCACILEVLVLVCTFCVVQISWFCKSLSGSFFLTSRKSFNLVLSFSIFSMEISQFSRVILSYITVHVGWQVTPKPWMSWSRSVTPRGCSKAHGPSCDWNFHCHLDSDVDYWAIAVQWFKWLPLLPFRS